MMPVSSISQPRKLTISNLRRPPRIEIANRIGPNRIARGCISPGWVWQYHARCGFNEVIAAASELIALTLTW